MAHPAPEAIREFVAQLAEQDARWLFHVLRCSMCRDLALAQWPEAPEEQVPATKARRKPPILWHGRKEAEALLTVLLQLKPKAREWAVREDRFHKHALLELILAKSEEAQTDNPRLAVDLAWLAIALAKASGLCGRLWRAYNLAGNANRLAGEMEEAERCLDSAALCRPVASEERGLLCRTLALLRWDRGFACEAESLLRHASELFIESADSREEGICLALLGLLHAEEREYAEGLGPLLRTRQPMHVELPPWLAARTGLSLALCLACAGDPAEAQRFREEAWDLYGSIKDPLEISRIQALEGRLAAELGDLRQAEELLDSARRKMLANRWLAEASMVSLELALLFIEANRREDIGGLIAELEANSAGLRGREVAARALQQLADDELTPRERVKVLAAHTRRMFRYNRIAEPVVRWL